MRIFKEEQAFRQWWLILIMGSTVIVTAIPFFGDDEFVKGNWKYFSFIPVLLVVILLWILKLHTRIDARGISCRFEPLDFFKRCYNWNDISKCYVRKYSPLREYGGWGVRGFRKARAYNVSGNMGIQIVTKNQESFLIGTNKPEDAERIIKRYREKLNVQ